MFSIIFDPNKDISSLKYIILYSFEFASILLCPSSVKITNAFSSSILVNSFKAFIKAVLPASIKPHTISKSAFINHTSFKEML